MINFIGDFDGTLMRVAALRGEEEEEKEEKKGRTLEASLALYCVFFFIVISYFSLLRF